MKRNIFISFTVILFLSGCKKNNLNEAGTWDIKITEKALVKFLNSYTALTPSASSPANGPSINYYINGVKMNATALAYTGLFPVTNGAYSQAPSGLVNIKAILNRAGGTALPGDTIANSSLILTPDKEHDIILVDQNPNTDPLFPNLVLLQQPPSLPASGNFRLRLLNLIATTEVYDLYNSTTATIVISNVSFKKASDWVELPLTGSSSNAYQLRLTGTTTVMATLASFTPANLRSYTFWARGNPAVSGRTRTLTTYVSK